MTIAARINRLHAQRRARRETRRAKLEAIGKEQRYTRVTQLVAAARSRRVAQRPIGATDQGASRAERVLQLLELAALRLQADIA
jgi:hypothetical protein